MLAMMPIAYTRSSKGIIETQATIGLDFFGPSQIWLPMNCGGLFGKEFSKVYTNNSLLI